MLFFPSAMSNLLPDEHLPFVGATHNFPRRGRSLSVFTEAKSYEILESDTNCMLLGYNRRPEVAGPHSTDCTGSSGLVELSGTQDG